MPALRLYLFGPPRLEAGDQPIHITRRKASALLAYLACLPQPHSRDALATLFWPDYDRRQGRADLSRTLSVLNKVLGPDALLAERDIVQLNPAAPFWLDIHHFRQLRSDCETHAHTERLTCAACLERLAQAGALYQDHFLAGFTLPDSPDFDAWQTLQSEGLRQELNTMLEWLAQGYVAEQKWTAALATAQRWVDQEPLHEPAHQLLMRVHAQSGQRAAALAHYELCRQLLAEEMGIEPSQATQSLAEQIRRDELGPRSALSPPAPAHPSPAPSVPALSGPPRLPAFLDAPAAPVPDDSPAARPVFVARERELHHLHSHLQAMLDGQGRVVFLTGEAGRGKTALLREFARRAQASRAGLLVAMGNCSAYAGRGDPFLPFRDALNMLCGDVEADWDAGLLTQAQAIQLWTLFPQTVQALVESGPDLVEVMVAGAALVQRRVAAGQGDSAPVQQLRHLLQTAQTATHALEPRQLFEQYTQVLQRLAAQQPLLLLLDDLQWADSASLDLLFHLGRRLAHSRILVLAAYRPSEVALAQSHAPASPPAQSFPLKAMVNEFTRQYGPIQLDLSQVTQAEGRGFVDGLLDSRPNQLRESFRALLYQRTQGHPLFTVELLAAMRAQGALVQDAEGYWVEGEILDWEILPARVEAVIEQRLDRLDPHLRELLAVASVEGAEFTVEIIARVQETDVRTVLGQLSQELERQHGLVREHGEVRVGAHRLSRYQFNHVLFQHYLYRRLSRGQQRLLHGQLAALLEELYDGQTGPITAQLARHYVEAGQDEKAVDYLIQAGDQARSLYAYPAAADHYRQAIAFLEQGSDAERLARTLMKLGLTYHMDLDFQQAGQIYERGFNLWQAVSASQSEPPASPRHVLRGHWSDPSTVDPALAGQIEALSIIDQLFSGLVELSPGMNVVPALAHHWEVFDKGQTYLFHLRPDARWNDGAPLTAADFAYAWKRVLDPATRAPEPSTLFDIRGARAFHQGAATSDQVGIYVQDPHTLRVELEGPAGYFPHLLTLDVAFPVPRHVVEAHGPDWTRIEYIATNGPFQLERWQPGDCMVLARNPHYHGPSYGTVERVELSFDTDPEQPLLQYAAGELDILSHFSLRKIPAPQQEWMRQRYANDLISAPGLYTNFLAFDASRPPFADRRVRQAIAMATDRAALVAARRSNELPAQGGFVPPGMPGHSPDIGLPYAPTEAQQLLAAAGYPGGQGFPAIELLAFQSHRPFCESLQRQWRQTLGIEVSLRVENSRYVRRLADEGVHLCILAWMADYPDPVNFLDLNESIQMGQWQNADYAVLVHKARRETDQTVRRQLYAQADTLLMQEAPLMPLAYGHKNILVKPWVKRYPISAFKFWYWKDVVIERDG